jgi:hypothetical protein
MNREEVINSLMERYGWTDRFAKEFLSESRYARSLYQAYEDAYNSVWIDHRTDVPEYNNPFVDEVVQEGL